LAVSPKRTLNQNPPLPNTSQELLPHSLYSPDFVWWVGSTAKVYPMLLKTLPQTFLTCLILNSFLWLVGCTGSTHATDFQAKVIHIAAGDTITVLNDTNEKIKIRLNGIDCPEKSQAYDQDKYGRTIGDVILDDGRSLSRELVKAGYAWWYRKYAPNDTVLEKFEAVAREAKEGLWNNPHPIPPWDFRHRGERTSI
jgi:micrococcal nuclease